QGPPGAGRDRQGVGAGLEPGPHVLLAATRFGGRDPRQAGERCAAVGTVANGPVGVSVSCGERGWRNLAPRPPRWNVEAPEEPFATCAGLSRLRPSPGLRVRLAKLSSELKRANM